MFHMFPIFLHFIGWINYVTFIVLGIIFVVLGFSKPDFHPLTQILLFPAWFWIGWWFKRGFTARAGLLFGHNFEIKSLSNYLFEKTNGYSHKFLIQLLFLIVLWLPMCSFVSGIV